MRPLPILIALVACAGLAAAEGGGAAKHSRLSGAISAIDGDKVTITKGGDGGSTSETVFVVAGSQILIETERTAGAGGEGGGKRLTNPGELKDLAVGDPVTATYDASKQAITIVEHLPKRKSGGGGETKPAPAAPKDDKPRGETK